MCKFYLYAHGGSGNHGCEAIVRSTIEILKGLKPEKIILISSNPEEDRQYGIEEICEIRKDIQPFSKFSMDFLHAYYTLKLKKDYIPMDKMQYRSAIYDMVRDDLAFSIGGDNYCYADVKRYGMLHQLMKEKGAKTILWGCSVEPSVLSDKDISNDLASYDLITARETITYEALKKVNPNIVLVCDPAFQLKKEAHDPCSIEDNSVGINLSPMVIDNEKLSGIAYKNYINLVDYILCNTTMNIVLIPHVVWNGGDDRLPLQSLYETFKDTGRIRLLDDYSCTQIKYAISQCRFFVGARTHSTIAAYSSNVPTLVLGYSVKARGIAKDIFGTESNYVISVQNLKSEDDLCNAFKWMESNEQQIKMHFSSMMNEYKQRAFSANAHLEKEIC